MHKWIAILLISLWSVAGYSAQDAVGFSSVHANEVLLQASQNLNRAKGNIVELEKTVAQLIDLQKAARDCVKEMDDKIQEVKKQLKVAEEKTEEQDYLKKRKAELEQKQSQCRLFDIRAEDTVEAYTNAIQEQVATKLFKLDTPVWENIAKSPALLTTLDDNFDAKKFIDKSGVQLLTDKNIYSGAAVILFGMILGAAIRRFLRSSVMSERTEVLSKQMFSAFCSVLFHYAMVLLPVLFLTLFLFVLEVLAGTSSYLLHLGYALSVYLFVMMAVRFLIRPPNPQFTFNRLTDKIGRRLVRRFRMLGILSVIAYCAFIVIHDQALPQQFIHLLETLFIILISINLVAIIWIVNQLPVMIYKYQTLRVFVSFLLTITLVSIVTAEVIGFHNLAFHVLQGLLWSILLFTIAWFINKVVIAAIDSLSDETHPWQQRLHYFLGMKKNETLTELVWIRLISYLVILGTFLALLLQVWGLSETDVRLLINSFSDGFTIAGLKIVPSKIVFALFVFTSLMLLTRVVRGYFLRHAKLIRDSSARFALSTILGYIGFVSAVVISLLVAGVDFTGIAIIAGALSVGVGFGLQNIVNNFLSGLILLVERPIKLGDRILVGNTEGYVRKISIRSTRIRTQSRTDVIVPNSELIALQVTNLMFHDRFLRVTVPVGVAYGSDTELVKKVLLQVAKENKNVADLEAHKPKVLFRQFGASSLNFELWCIILDADQINNVPSELHFAIDKAFRENGIVIAFPQQDVYIKSLPKDVGKKE